MSRRHARFTEVAPARVKATEAAQMLGVTSRTVQTLAAQGLLPGAAKIGGGHWTFNPDKLARFLAEHGGKLPRGYGAPVTKIDRITEQTEHGEKVYVVGYGQYVKIGYSRVMNGARIASIQRSCPEKLVTYAVFSGGLSLERALHKRFKEYRLNGEWFQNTGSLTRWIANGCPLAGRGGKVFITAKGLQNEQDACAVY